MKFLLLLKRAQPLGYQCGPRKNLVQYFLDTVEQIQYTQYTPGTLEFRFHPKMEITSITFEINSIKLRKSYKQVNTLKIENMH